MTTTVEVSEWYTLPPVNYGSTVPVRRLPDKHSQITTGTNPADTITLNAKTKLVSFLPAADARFAWTDGKAGPSDPGGSTSCKLLKAGIEKEFFVDTASSQVRFGLA